MHRVWVASVLAVPFAAVMSLIGVQNGGLAAPTAYLDEVKLAETSKGTETVKYYDVRGSSIDELRRDVFSRGPYDERNGQRYAGWAEWRIQWSFDRRVVPQGCAVSRAATETHVQYTLPRWVDADKAPAELRKRWREFVEALMQHELGHGQLARELADRIEFAIESLPPEPTCEELDRRVNELATRMILEDDTQEAYDRETLHGQTQGAAFPSIVVRASAK
jgi:Predicted secreted Zn-dependent protease